VRARVMWNCVDDGKKTITRSLSIWRDLRCSLVLGMRGMFRSRSWNHFFPIDSDIYTLISCGTAFSLVALAAEEAPACPATIRIRSKISSLECRPYTLLCSASPALLHRGR
jgi:hypothetical protein